MSAIEHALICLRREWGTPGAPERSSVRHDQILKSARAELAAMREVIARADELVNVTDRLGEQVYDVLRFYKGALPDAVEANISRVKNDAKLAILNYRAARESVK